MTPESLAEIEARAAAASSSPEKRSISQAVDQKITEIAAMTPGARVYCFWRFVLGVTSPFELAVITNALKNDEPLTEYEMRYIAAYWNEAEAYPRPAGQMPICANCGKPICRSDLTMKGPAGPWIHEDNRTRRCWLADDYYAAPISQRVSRG